MLLKIDRLDFYKKLKDYCEKNGIELTVRKSRKIKYEFNSENRDVIEEVEVNSYKYNIKIQGTREIHVIYEEEEGLFKITGVGLLFSDIRGIIKDIMIMANIGKGYIERYTDVGITNHEDFEFEKYDVENGQIIKMNRVITLCCNDTYAVLMLLKLKEIVNNKKYHLRGEVEYNDLGIKINNVLNCRNKGMFNLDNRFGEFICDKLAKLYEVNKVESLIESIERRSYYKDSYEVGYTEEVTIGFYISDSCFNMPIGVFEYSYSEWQGEEEKDVVPQKLKVTLGIRKRVEGHDISKELLAEVGNSLFTEINMLNKGEDLNTLLTVKGVLMNCKVSLADLYLMVVSDYTDDEHPLQDKFEEYDKGDK